MIKSKKQMVLYGFVLLTGIISCVTGPYFFRSNYRDANALIHESKNLQTKPYLKAHMKNGEVYIFQDSWVIDSVTHKVNGTGALYDLNRKLVREGNIVIDMDEVAIYETNTKIVNSESSRVAALSIIAGLDVALGVFCLVNPKACFGSCPTFYQQEVKNIHYADAEGFSNAIAPSLEYGDIDALHNGEIKDGQFDLIMKNEALETHAINEVKLMAYPRKEKERIFHDPAHNFYRCENNLPMINAWGEEGDIRKYLAHEDKIERSSLADESNMAHKEEIFLEFENSGLSRKNGLILDFRQTLMTTYLIYSAMGYMGDEVSDIFARMERDPKVNQNLKNGIRKVLGGIDVYLWETQKNEYTLQGSFNETGPIAINKQILPLAIVPDQNPIRIKLILNKGLWRLDYAAVTAIKQKVEPITILPTLLMRGDKSDQATLDQMSKPNGYLVSLPGDEYKFTFRMPEVGTDYELFLYSKGYYLEWMRANWLKDKDLLKLRQMIYNPEKYLASEAKNFKRYETTMEAQFWNSKIDHQTLTSHEK